VINREFLVDVIDVEVDWYLESGAIIWLSQANPWSLRESCFADCPIGMLRTEPDDVLKKCVGNSSQAFDTSRMWGWGSWRLSRLRRFVWSSFRRPRRDCLALVEGMRPERAR
jgi:hypothetical protein